MAKLTYEQIRRLRDTTGHSDIPLEVYAAALNKGTGTQNYEAGTRTGLGKLAHEANYWIDRGINYTGLPDFTGAIGQQAFGEAGEQAFRYAPRMAVDMLPALLGGIPAAVGMAGTAGLSTFGQTDSGGAAAAAAAIGSLTGPLMNLGSAGARGVAGALGANVGRLSSTFTPEAALGLKAMYPGLKTTLAAQKPFATVAGRTADMVGKQAGMFAGNVLGNAVPAAIAAPDGQGWDAFKEQFSGVNLAATALAQAPFAAMQGVRDMRQTPEARFAAANKSTFEKYYFERQRPAEIRDELRAAVDRQLAEQQPKQLALPAPRTETYPTAEAFTPSGTDPAGRTPAQQAARRRKLEKTYAAKMTRLTGIPLGPVLLAAKTPASAPSTPKFEAAVKASGELAKAAQVAANPWTTSAPEGYTYRSLPVEEQAKLVASDDPEVAVPAALNELGVDKDAVNARMEGLVQEGLSEQEAASEVVVVITNKARKQVKKKADKATAVAEPEVVPAVAKPEPDVPPVADGPVYDAATPAGKLASKIESMRGNPFDAVEWSAFQQDYATMSGNKGQAALVAKYADKKADAQPLPVPPAKKPVGRPKKIIENNVPKEKKLSGKDLAAQQTFNDFDKLVKLRDDGAEIVDMLDRLQFDTKGRSRVTLYKKAVAWMQDKENVNLDDLQKELNAAARRLKLPRYNSKSRQSVLDANVEAPKVGVEGGQKFPSREAAFEAKEALRLKYPEWGWSIQQVEKRVGGQRTYTGEYTINRWEWEKVAASDAAFENAAYDGTPLAAALEAADTMQKPVAKKPEQKLAKAVKTDPGEFVDGLDSSFFAAMGDTPINREKAKVVLRAIVDSVGQPKSLFDKLRDSGMFADDGDMMDFVNDAFDIQSAWMGMHDAKAFGPTAVEGLKMVDAKENLGLGLLQGNIFTDADGNVQRFGNMTIGKSGMMRADMFAQKAGLSKDVAKLLQETYPAAWQEGNVNLTQLVKEMQARPLVETHVYGQNPMEGAHKVKQDRLIGELDALGIHAVIDSNGIEVSEFRDRQGRLVDQDTEGLSERVVRLMDDLIAHGYRVSPPGSSDLRATSYYNQISPFDTKEYPVVRVDVVLPMTEPAKDAIVQRNAFGPDAGKAALWQQDNLHENLPNTLGWAMVQFVPDPKTGEMVAFIGEQQSRWGQSERTERPRRINKLQQGIKSDEVTLMALNTVPDATPHPSGEGFLSGDYQFFSDEAGAVKATKKYRAELETRLTKDKKELSRLQENKFSHPLLDLQHQLVLKAVINEARKRGVSKVVLSDGETAMMTEMHDTVASGEVPQEKGMRQYYDLTLPGTMRKLTGTVGVPWDGGAHKNAGKLTSQGLEDANYSNEAYETLASAQQRVRELGDNFEVMPIAGGFGIRAKRLIREVTGSPVFRNADGTPKANVTGLLFDLEAAGTRAFGDPAAAARFEQMQLGQLLDEVGLSDPMHLEEATRLLSLHDMGDVGFGKLGPNSEALGLFTQRGDGQKLVWLAAQKSPERVKFVLSHEFLGHGIWELHREGKLDADSSRKLQEFADFVGEVGPEQSQLMLKEVWHTLPDKYRKDKGLLDLVSARANDPDEVLANLTAMVALTTVANKPSRLKDFMRFVPSPVANFMATGAKYLRKFFTAIAGRLFQRRMETGETLEAAGEQQLGQYLDTVRGLLKVDAQRQMDIANAVHMQMSSKPELFSKALATGELLNTAGLDPSTVKVWKEFSGVPDDQVEFNPIKRTVKGLSTAWDNGLQLVLRVAQKYPMFKRAAALGVVQEDRTTRHMTDIMRELSMKFDGVTWTSDKNSPVLKVGSDPVLSSVRDKLIRRASVKEMTAADLVNAKDADAMAEMNRLTPEQQKLVMQSIAMQQAANAKTNSIVTEMQKERFVRMLGKVMMLEDSTLPYAKAENSARQMMAAVEAGTATGASKAELFAMAGLQRIQQDAAFMQSRPWYVSEQRFGDFEVRWKYKDPTKKDGMVRAKSVQELQTIMRDLERRRVAEGIDRIIDRPVKHEPFNAARATLDVWAQMEREANSQLVAALEGLGIAPDVARTTVESVSAVAEMQREVAMKEMPALKVQKRHADGREYLDMLQQQLDSTSVLVHGLSKSVANAEHAMWMVDPEIINHEQRPLFEQAWKNYREPDSKAVKNIRRAGYYAWMPFHFFNMIQDAAAPLTGSLTSDFVFDGMGIVQANKHVTGWMNKLFKHNLKKGKGDVLSAEQATVLERYRTGNRGLASYSDELNNDLLSALDARRLTEGKDALHPSYWLRTKLGLPLIWSKKFHKRFTDYGMESAFMAAFDHFRTKGQNVEDAYRSALEFSATSMASAGKSGRAVGIWSADKLKPVSAIVTTLQTYAFNQIGAMKNYFEEALKGLKFGTMRQQLNEVQRKQALKALGLQTSLLASQAGLLGLPFVGAALTMIDKLFGVNSREWLADQLTDDDPEDANPLLAQFALHGALNMLGTDMASRSGVPGVLGINARTGFDAASLMGPLYESVSRVVNGVSDTVQGKDATAAVRSLLPNTIQRALQFEKDGFEFRRKDGSLIAETSTMEKALYAATGLRPTDISVTQEAESWQRLDADLERDERQEWTKEVLSMLDSGSYGEAQAMLQRRAAERPTESTTAIASALAARQVERMYGRDPRRAPGYSERLGQVTGMAGTGLSESQRTMLMQQVMQQLGVQMPASRLRAAGQVDAMRQGRPWLPYSAAQAGF